ncbi:MULTISPECIES: hypothetical protein [Sutcliffiella]|uniref:Uncharacterized protein n=1 Tax=Sutcliffiella cohnii TaxID=33932 RepID=A0A223KKN5_9BACI|nr:MULTISPECIES: hypothetical protein [Sutcliffiella]AST90041.1 hypothetical protein BC6307_01450 [Sutcliffiella cohnii]WBL15669.1 hypothetical protein O1A01_03190 [Sutcliffiella sp. NC1]
MKEGKQSFKESYSSNWVYTLKQVEELKNILLSKTTEEVLFWSDGTWASRKQNIFWNDKEDPLFTFTKNEIQFINQDTVENSLYSICHLIFGLDHPLSNLDIHEYLLERKNTDIKSFLQRDLFRKNHHTYSFVFTYGHLNFKCSIEWENSSRSLRVLLDDGTIGIADGIRYIINYLFDLSDEIRNEYDAFILFCREIRKFEEYYYNSKNECISQTTTPTEVLMLQREMTTDIIGNYIKVADLLDYFQLDIPFPKSNDKEKYIDFNDLFDDYHDLYGYMDVGAIESHIYWFVNNNILEPFDIRKEKCIYTNSYEILLDKSYLIEWNYLEECFRIKETDESYKYFDSARTLIDYLLSNVSDSDKKFKDIYNKNIEQLAYKICENLDDNHVYKYLLNMITTYEETKLWRNSLLNDPDLPF